MRLFKLAPDCLRHTHEDCHTSGQIRIGPTTGNDVVFETKFEIYGGSLLPPANGYRQLSPCASKQPVHDTSVCGPKEVQTI
jgi:hypothetical protein